MLQKIFGSETFVWRHVPKVQKNREGIILCEGRHTGPLLLGNLLNCCNLFMQVISMIISLQKSDIVVTLELKDQERPFSWRTFVEEIVDSNFIGICNIRKVESPSHQPSFIPQFPDRTYRLMSWYFYALIACQ